VAEDLDVDIAEEVRLSEEGYWPDPDAGLVRLLEVAALEGRAVLCSQGGVIPSVVQSLAEMGGLRLEEIPCKKGSTWVLAFTRPFGTWSTSDSPSRWPTLVSAHYLPSALARP
jgi:8-oxo-dGTP diphosphatase